MSGASRTVCPFVFSREFCGSDETGYVPTLYYREGMTTLNEATFMAACSEGSPVGSATGELLSHLIPGRHGVWIENPRFYGKDTLLNRREGGGTVLVEPRVLGAQGRFAVIRDPAGAALALWESTTG